MLVLQPATGEGICTPKGVAIYVAILSLAAMYTCVRMYLCFGEKMGVRMNVMQVSTQM
uniref:Uncharacterized protein n=1 Tax=Anguilla anguilla TaxID=7936 RepID=A0A0E9WHJ2_ANGAN